MTYQSRKIERFPAFSVTVAIVIAGTLATTSAAQQNSATAAQPGVFHGKMYYGQKGNVAARLELHWTTDRQLVGYLMQGEHTQRLTEKHLGFVGSVQEVRGFPGDFSFFDLVIEQVHTPSKSTAIETWPSNVATMRFSQGSEKLSVSVRDGTRGEFEGLPPIEIPASEASRRPIVTADFENEKSLHGDWIAQPLDQDESSLADSQIYRFDRSTMTVLTNGRATSVMTYITRPDFTSKAIDLIRFGDGAIEVSRMIYQIEGDQMKLAFGPRNSERPQSFEAAQDITLVHLQRTALPKDVESTESLSEKMLAALRHDGQQLSESEIRALLGGMLRSESPLDRAYVALVCRKGHFGALQNMPRAKQLANDNLQAVQQLAAGSDPLAKFLLWRLVDLSVVEELGFPAEQYLDEAAEAGLPNAQYRLAARILLKNRQSLEAYRWLIRAAPFDSLAREELAFWHLNEQRKNRKTPELAWVLALAGARDGRSDLYTQVSLAYEQGSRGKPSLATAVAWCESGAALGNAMGHHNLGVHALNAEDYPKALKHFTLAAEDDLAISKTKLGMMHMYGLGVPQDLETARKLLASVDNSEAVFLRRKIRQGRDGSLSLGGGLSLGESAYSGSFDQADYESQIRRLRNSMQRNIGHTGVIIGR